MKIIDAGRRVLAALPLLCAAMVPAAAKEPELRLLFTGDILLSRQVAQEWTRRGVSPWLKFAGLFQSADWVGGNLEGVVGDPADCLSSQSPCFAIRAELLALAGQAGFAALTQENNHAGDLGDAARQHTTAALAQAGVLGLSFARSPQFFRRGDYTLALVAVNTVPGADGKVQQIPSVALAQKLRLAAQLAQVVIVSVHWGQELVDWPVAGQRAQAQWLVKHGADVVVGHHPHVVQEAACVDGRPVFYSLGNHLFDQKYPQSKQGAVADCRIAAGRLACGTLATQTPPGTTYPQLQQDGTAGGALADCKPLLREALHAGEVEIRPEPWSAGLPPDTLALEGWREDKRVWRSRRQRLLSLQQAYLAGADQPPLLFALEQHASPLDEESGVRPYVYAVGAQGLVAKWRGSALAWPLLDAVAVPSATGAAICALHRGDSFLALQPDTRATRLAAYRWNGFGFSGVDEPAAAACAPHFE
jgi:Bacterial capsule synthesis protein PGA_cap